MGLVASRRDEFDASGAVRSVQSDVTKSMIPGFRYRIVAYAEKKARRYQPCRRCSSRVMSAISRHPDKFPTVVRGIAESYGPELVNFTDVEVDECR